MDKIVSEKYESWLKNAIDDEDLIKELKSIGKDEDKINDAFYRDLEFGTGGLRGVIGAGTNRMNIYIVRKASQGLANYLNNNFKNPSIAVSYDSRIKSDLFAKEAASVFAANGIHVYIYKHLMPTPCLSFAVRELKCSAGIIVTASHNPSEYNGYKVYNDEGCQITDNAAKAILGEISKLDPFNDVKKVDFKEGLKTGVISFISKEVEESFVESVLKMSLLKDKDIDKNIKIVYTPLHGTGLVPVIKTLKRDGFKKIKIVKCQKSPDGRFLTCPFPNPEIREAMLEGIKCASKCKADLVMATDPDCDRIGIAVKEGEDYVLLTGNQVGVLLFDFICKQRLESKLSLSDKFVVRTIVTTTMIDKIAEKYGIQVKKLLTGFKYIGEFIGELEKEGKKDAYIFGFEESYGYLSGTHARDKDAVNGALLIAELFAYYKSVGKSLTSVLNELYDEYGYYLNKLNSIELKGQDGQKKIVKLMEQFRSDYKELGGFKIVSKTDYSVGVEGLPKSNVICFELENGSKITIRPSGTEPKVKIYFEVHGKNKKECLSILNTLEIAFKDITSK